MSKAAQEQTILPIVCKCFYASNCDKHTNIEKDSKIVFDGFILNILLKEFHAYNE